ncbi:Uncharacterised protein [Mycobacteroides abscessus subsp. bolletii]|nr:Uncharacterised protein [Mycobacteroides abscessus subsp. bolletii]SIM83449.1 Uncharacterised protein [Mycobacteroides abscessus subsp. abscessus]
MASPSPSHSDFREPDQVGPQANSRSAKISKSSIGRMRSIRSMAASTGSAGSAASGAGSASSPIPVTTVPSAFNDQSTSRSP